MIQNENSNKTEQTQKIDVKSKDSKSDKLNENRKAKVG